MSKIFELLVISGKGGTGKTSVAASMAALAGRSVIADCDVDASDMHLLLSPQATEAEDFYAGRVASIRQAACVSCGACHSLCRFDAVLMDEACASAPVFSIDPTRCEGCGVCVKLCPMKAINFDERHCGSLSVSETRFGPMAHARLEPGGENSGKLVAAVKAKARELSESKGLPFIIIDGPPGVGCPVIASVSGASLALLVAEPTLACLHDLTRAMELLRHFSVPSALCINRWDVNSELSAEIERLGSGHGAAALGRIRYDKAFSQAQSEAKTLPEAGGPAAEDLKALWKRLLEWNEGLREAAASSN